MTREINQWRIYYKPSKMNTATIRKRSLIHGYEYNKQYGYNRKNSVYHKTYGFYFFTTNKDISISTYYSMYNKIDGITRGLLYTVSYDKGGLIKLQYTL